MLEKAEIRDKRGVNNENKKRKKGIAGKRNKM